MKRVYFIHGLENSENSLDYHSKRDQITRAVMKSPQKANVPNGNELFILRKPLSNHILCLTILEA